MTKVVDSGCAEVLAEVRGSVGFITLNRPKALNALSLEMIRALTGLLLAWREDAAVQAVAIRGSDKHGVFGGFCAGGDIRFFHAAALAGDPRLEDFFTEEYALNHLIHGYPKPYIAFMDGIVMGGGMGISQGAKLRLVTERSKLAMPETNIGLFPDVGGGYFLSRCPGRVGEWLALTGDVIGGTDAIAFGLADVFTTSDRLAGAWEALATLDFGRPSALEAWQAAHTGQPGEPVVKTRVEIDLFFGLESVKAIIQALEGATAGSPWAAHTATALRKRSPLMLHVVLEQIRRARQTKLSLADDLRMERDLVRHCFHLRAGRASETVEGVRALAVDKDHSPKWNPPRIEDVTPEMVVPFFASPWPAHAHPLRALD
jgi:enoyl-CoA hydratase/carnithine racemase